MALPSTLYRFQISLSDIDRNIYQNLDVRVAMHPSESLPYFLCRVLAYALSWQPGLEFSQGLSQPDDPALWLKDTGGKLLCWMEIGQPSAKRLHRACKQAGQVLVYSHKDPRLWLEELRKENIFGRERLQLFGLEENFLNRLGAALERANSWTLLIQERRLSLHTAGQSFEGEIRELSL